MRAAVKSNLLDVELGASGLSAADLAIYLDSYKRHQTFVRLTSGDIVRWMKVPALRLALPRTWGSMLRPARRRVASRVEYPFCR